MTPKEKAEELFDKFNNPDKTNYPYIHNAQQCALIAVDEIIEIFEFMVASNLENHQFVAILNYWDEVKQEIEKL